MILSIYPYINDILFLKDQLLIIKFKNLYFIIFILILIIILTCIYKLLQRI